MIGIIGAMDEEIELILENMSDKNVEKISNIDFINGTISNKKCVVAKCNPGKVNAAICAQTMILKFSPKYIINTGIAGSLTNLLDIGDIAVGKSVIQHDIDTTAIGDEIGTIPGLDLVNIPCSEHLLKATELILKMTSSNFLKGAVLTGDQFINKREKLKSLCSKFNGIACEMEGGSIGHVCYVNNVEFIVIRSISDGANSNSTFDYKKFTKLSSQMSSKLVIKLLKQL